MLCWKSINSSQSLNRLMSRKPPCRPSRKSCHKNIINKAVANFTKCSTVYMAMAASGGHFEHLQYICLSSCLRSHLITNKPPLFHRQTAGEDWARNAKKWLCLGWNSIILSFSCKAYTPTNLAVKYIYVIALINSCIQKKSAMGYFLKFLTFTLYGELLYSTRLVSSS